MFKLVGNEIFEIGEPERKAKCEILINASSGFTYEYSIMVNGKQLKKFREKQSKVMKTWFLELPGGEQVRVALGKIKANKRLHFFGLSLCSDRERFARHLG